MRPLTEQEIRGAFVNCSKGEAKRLNVPRDLAQQPWEDLDYLGWRDPKAPERAYLVAELDGQVTGLALRAPAPVARGRGMCSICVTTHSGGVSLVVAPKAGKAGKAGDSVGTYLCGDLACSLYVRGKRDSGEPNRETLGVEERSRRIVVNLSAFVARVTG